MGGGTGNGLRILAVDTHWFSERGGINTFNRHLCAALARAGAEVCCLVPAATPVEKRSAADLGVTLVGPRPTPRTSERVSLLSKPVLPKGFVPDVIIGHGRVTGPAAKAQAKRFDGAVHIHIMHTAPDEIGPYKGSRGQSREYDAEVKTDAEVDLARSATCALAVGPRLHEELKLQLRRFPGTSAPGRLDPGFDGIELLQPEPPGQYTQVLVLGRLDDEDVKGLDIAAKAVGYAAGEIEYQIRLLLRGVPPDENDALTRKVRKWAGRPDLRVDPRRYSADSARLEADLRQTTVVLMPSRAEGFGLVGAEAIAAGTPVLISSRSGLADLVSEVAKEHWPRVVVPVVMDPKVDPRRWGNAVAALLRYPIAAFADAADLSRRMRAARTWDMAAQNVLAQVAKHRRAAVAGAPLTATNLAATASTARRDTLSVLVRYAGQDGARLFRRLRTEVATMGLHVDLWPLPTSTGRDVLDDTLHKVDAVIAIVPRASAEHDMADPVLDQIGRYGRDIPVLVVQEDSPAEWHRVLRLLDEFGAPEPVTKAAPASSPPAQTTPAQEVRLINEMPHVPSVSFRDRQEYLDQLCVLINDTRVRVVMLEGRDGIGKTAMLRQLRDHVADACLNLRLDAFVYLSARGYRWITTTTLLTDLTRAAGDVTDDPRPWRQRLDEVAAAVRGLAILVVVDDADDLFDDRGECKDRELRELLIMMAERDDHEITFVLCVHDKPRVFMADLRRRVRPLPIGEGLPRPWAKDLLRSLDRRKLAAASEAHLDRLYDLTKGHPRSLELAGGLLFTSAWTVEGLLAELDAAQNVLNTLLTLMFKDLSRTERRVVQALAVYARPVQPDAADHLLRDLVARPDSRNPLDRLTERNLVHRRAGYYYLPPKPDAEFILTTVLDDDTASADLSRTRLRKRAAEYFAGRRVRRPRTADDLWPQFGEIELRLRAGDFVAALTAMDDVDDLYLTGWGQSHILASWREELKGHLVDPALEGRNLSYLVAARQQHYGHPTNLANLNLAWRHAQAAGDDVNAMRVRRQLAEALFDLGDVSGASDLYRDAVAHFARLGLPADEAGARNNLAICLLKAGGFEAAEAELRRGQELVRPLPLDDSRYRRLRARLVHNRGWLAGQLGLDETALQRLDEALTLVAQSDDVLRGTILNAKAAVLLYSRDPRAAQQPAKEAADIGLRRSNHTLSREAHVNLALALALTEDDEAAMKAADLAAGFSDTPQALGALAVEGLIAFRRDDRVKASRALSRAFKKSDERFSRDQCDYQMLDARGLILCALALLREAEVEDSVVAFEAARSITKAVGVVRRNQVLLAQFGEHADQGILAQVRRAAAGETMVDRPA